MRSALESIIFIALFAAGLASADDPLSTPIQIVEVQK